MLYGALAGGGRGAVGVGARELVVARFAVSVTRTIRLGSLSRGGHHFGPSRIFRAISRTDSAIRFLVDICRGNSKPLICPILLRSGACVNCIRTIPFRSNG